MNENEWERVKTLLIPRYEELITKKKVKDAQELGYINYLISRDLCKEKQDFLFLYLLVHLLPPKRTGRKRKKGDEEQATDNQPKSKLSLEERRESFILHVKNVGEIETKILEIKKRLQFDKGTFQPLIVAVGSSVKRIESYHLAVNDKLLLRNHFLGIEDIFQLRLIQNPSIQDFTYQDFQPNVQKEQIYFESDSDSDIYDYYENENSQSSRYNDFDDLDSCEYNAWENIQISYNNLSFLPDDGDIIDMILNANNTSNDEEIDDTNSDNDIESSGVFSFPNIDQQNHINIELNLNFPTTDTQPINEFTKEGYMVCAFLALFPTGRGDFLQNRLVTITCLNYFSAMNPTSAPLIANEHPSQIQFSTVSPQNYKDDLSSLITTLQRHTKCGKHCLRKSNGILKCRYKFPHELQQHSSNDDTNGYYKFLPVRNDPYVQRYNHVIAQIWRANTDFSPIVDTTTVIKYIAKYASKGEVSSRTYMKIIEDLCKNNNKNCTAHKGISKIWISTVSDRDYSAQEVVHILMGWPLYQSSRNVVVLPLYAISHQLQNIKLSEEQQKILEICQNQLQIIQNGSNDSKSKYAGIKRILIQGKAGSGKSTLIRRIFDEVTDKLGMDSIAVTAPTGAAAINIYDGKLSMTEYNTLLQREDVNLKQDKKQHFNKSIHLLPTNDLVQDKNETCLRNLNIPVVAINAENKPDVYVNNENISGIPNILYLSLGCRVMLCDNTWVDGCLVNGSLGTVMVILYEENVVPPSLPKYIMVEFDTYAGPFIKNRTFPITPIIRTREKYGMKLTTKQFPLKLAYAITIHKSQCLTLTSAIIDVGSKEFSSRLTYVALSRSKKLTYIMFSRFYDKSRFDSIAKAQSTKLQLKFLDNLQTNKYV
ncbi:hypothetical protein TKK_0002522 [Trichogramma kaykai]